MSDLHTRAVELACVYKKTEAQLVDVLQRIDAEKIFRKHGYASLFEYCLKALGLSESTTYNFITVARKSREIPQLKKAIECGELTVSKARKITPVITVETQNDWITKAKTLSSRELEKEVVLVQPKAFIAEKVKYVQKERLSVNLGISENLYERLKRVQDLECQRTQKARNIEETLDVLVDFYLKRNDPIEKAKRIVTRKNPDENLKRNTTESSLLEQAMRNVRRSNLVEQAGRTVTGIDLQPVTEQANRRINRPPIPSHIKHQVVLRDQNKCTYQDCIQSRWIHIHHIKPVSEGGLNNLDNLITLCSAHHRMVHEPAAVFENNIHFLK